MYKQRHQNSNKKSSRGANYAHIRYIATRPRVMTNEGQTHGLFGKLELGEVVEFEDWKDVSKLAYNNTKNGIIMFRGIISFSEETAKELVLVDQKAWQRYIERHMYTLATKNKIETKNLAWVCAVHNEKDHPHIHIAFWDKNKHIRNAFVAPKIPNDIRKQLIKNTFQDKILHISKQKDESIKSMRIVTDEMVEEFEIYFRQVNHKKYRKLMGASAEEENELMKDFNFTDKYLNSVADKVFRLRGKLPKKGRLSYQLLPPDVKEEVDKIVSFIVDNNKAIAKEVNSYVDVKMKIATMYGGSDDYLKSLEKKYLKEAEKIVANKVLGMSKALNRIDYENRSADFLQSTREYQTMQLFYSAMDLLQSNTVRLNNQFDKMSSNPIALSKDVKKELYLKYQDKGFEH